MSVTDTGWYIAPFPSAPYELRDQIVWPPGWELPGLTETITLDAALTVSSAGETVAGYTKATGERWVAQASASWSHRVGYVPGSAAGSYVAGNTVPMYRFPRFIAAKRTARGLNAPTFFNPNTRPSFVGLSETTSFRQRSALGIVQVNMLSTSGLVVDMTVTVGGFTDPTFNGVFQLLAVSGSLVFYRSAGPAVGITADTGGRISISQPEAIRRMHQLGGLKSWVRATGPAPGSPSTSASPITNSLTWIYNGVQLQQILIMGEPFDLAFNISSGTGAFCRRMVRVWAPVAAEISRDFAVDATLPTYGQIRVIWVDGIPQCSHPSGATAPYSGATLTGRQRGHTDRIASRDGVALYATLPEDAGRVRSIISLGTPLLGLGAAANSGAVRGDLFSTMWLKADNAPTTASATPFSAITVTGQWFRRRVNGVNVAFGTSFSVAYSILTFASTDYLQTDDPAIPVPFDATYGNLPGLFLLRVIYAYTVSGSPTTQTLDYYFQGDASGADSLRPTSFVPKLTPWPYNVPKMAFGADDAACQYVGHTGWLMVPVTYPVATVTPPTLSRAGTTITTTKGACAIAPPEDGVVPATRSVLLRAIALAVNAGDTSGFEGLAGTRSLTVAAFLGQSVDAQADDVWTVTASHVGSYGPAEHFSGKVVQNLP